MFREFFSFFGDLYKNRSLLIKFSLNDFKARYAGSMFGIIWAFITPLVTIGVYWFVFDVGLKAGMADDNVPFIIFLITGIVPWFFFQEALMSATNCFREYSFLVKKVVFNIKILPTAKIVSAFYTHLFFIALAIVITTLYGFSVSLYTVQIFYYLFCLIILLTGFTWITASLQPFFSDITQLIGLVMQVLMWGTPIMWSINRLSPSLQFVLKLNPLYYIVEGYRDAFYNHVWFWEHPQLTLYFWGFTIILLIIGSTVYNKLKPHFSDVL